jgi:hypothetical protein
LYERVPFAVYRRWPYINNSSLGPALRSGRHYELSLTKERPSTVAMDFGRLVHTLVLTPDEFDANYAIRPQFEEKLLWPYTKPKASNEYKGLVEQWEKEHSRQVAIEPHEMDRAQRCAAAAEQCLDAVRLSLEERKEVCAVAKCPETGRRLKARLDFLQPHMIVDLKSTADASRLEYDLVLYGYHRQAAFYQDVVFWVTGEILPVYLLAFETSEPYLTRMAAVGDELMREGRAQVALAIRRIARWEDRGYEGYDTPVEWRKPNDPSVDLMIDGRIVTVRG